MRLDAVLHRRNHTGLLPLASVRLSPIRYGWSAMGGPDFAEIEAAGDPLALWPLLAMLRTPVDIRDEIGEYVWWGFVNSVTVRIGAVEIGVTLDRLYNRVAIAYSLISPGSNTVGTRATTDWEQDDDSVATYGIKELLDSRDGCSPATAEARRDAILDRLRYPIPDAKFSARDIEASATLHCLGWWHTLDWQHFARGAGLEAHTVGSQSQAVGETADNGQVAQSFELTAGEAWTASTVGVRLGKRGDPTDNVLFNLCSDSAGDPGTILATGSIAGADVSSSRSWVTVSLNTEVPLALATTYWLVVARDGGVDEDDYYEVAVDEELGYAAGVLRIWDGVDWLERTDSEGDPADADMVFRIEGAEETTDQLERVITDSGQFLRGTEIIDDSGIYVSPYRDGDTSALYVLRQLLNDGTSSGRRLLATITRNRILYVYEEPTKAQSVIYLDAAGRPSTQLGNELRAHTCPVATWCELRDVIPTSVNMRALSDPSAFFVERAEFDVERQQWIPEARGIPSPFEIGQLVTEV